MSRVYNDFPNIRGKIKEIKEIDHQNGGLAVELQKDGTYVMYINKNKCPRYRIIDFYCS